MRAQRKKEGDRCGETIGWSFPRAGPIRARTEEAAGQWAVPPGVGAERQGNAVTTVKMHVEVC